MAELCPERLSEVSEKIEASAERNDGGPAFPGAHVAYPKDGPSEGVLIATGGMSLRDWFAGQAMTGIAQSVTESASRETGDAGRLLLQAIEGSGALAYALADAALAARK